VNEEDPERDPRYPGVEDLFRRATFLRETHPYPSMLLEEEEEEEGLFIADAARPRYPRGGGGGKFIQG